MKWYFQVSPHDTHDFDNTTAPILFDKTVDGKPRKLLAQAARRRLLCDPGPRHGASILWSNPIAVPLDYTLRPVAQRRASSDPG